MKEVALTAVERTLRVWLMPLGHDSGEGMIIYTHYLSLISGLAWLMPLGHDSGEGKII